MKNMEVHHDGLARPEQVRVDIKPKVEGVIVRIRLERGEAGIEPGLGQLNPAYIFDTFVAGPNNQFAVAAAKAVAANPATTYNPVLIWGGEGLGKTHLLHAIGHAIRRDQTEAKVVCCTAERFTHELLGALRSSRIDEFRCKFRSMDVLLIDDVRFFAGKARTQEEFLHTFNALYEARRQIVVTSDMSPAEIPELLGRLRLRFEWGLIADIQPPDVQTRQTILKRKAEKTESTCSKR